MFDEVLIPNASPMLSRESRNPEDADRIPGQEALRQRRLSSAIVLHESLFEFWFSFT